MEKGTSRLLPLPLLIIAGDSPASSIPAPSPIPSRLTPPPSHKERFCHTGTQTKGKRQGCASLLRLAPVLPSVFVRSSVHGKASHSLACSLPGKWNQATTKKPSRRELFSAEGLSKSFVRYSFSVWLAASHRKKGTSWLTCRNFPCRLRSML